MRTGAAAGAGVMSAAVLALAALFVPTWEGDERVGYRDLAGIVTTCSGHTRTAILGRTYTEEECRLLLRRDLEEHAALIRPCVPEGVPVESQAAFLSLAFNIGGGAFCRSTVARRVKAGDLGGACEAILAWDKVRVNGKLVVVRGLQNRRKAERELCVRGLLR
jgi:lysozyme